MIKQYSLLTLQNAINFALSGDHETIKKINQLQHKLLKITIRPLHLYFFMYFTENKIVLLAETASTPDTHIESSPLGLIRLSLLPASKVRSLFNDHVKITGDVLLGQTIKALFDEIDIDWEGHLAHFTGDVIAHQMGRFVRHKKQFATALATSFKQNISEYIQEEACITPPREALADLMNEIDALALQVERLEARIAQQRQHAK